MRDRPDHPYFGPEPVRPASEFPEVSAKRSLAKALSWRLVGTIDTLILSFVILTFLGPLFGMDESSAAENAQTATLIAVTEVVTKMALYYVHERLWARSRWDIGVTETGARREGPRRSGVKTATWRVTASLDTMLLAWLFTGNIGTAISIGGLEVLTKLVLYYVHERGWARVSWGMDPTS